MPIPQVPSPLQSILASSTYNAAWFSGSTVEVQIQNAINAAATDGALYVFIPASMYGYNAALVTFNAAVKMTAENGAAYGLDILAYGAIPNGDFTKTTAAIQAALTQARLTNVYHVVISRGGPYYVNTLTMDSGVVFEAAGFPSLTATSPVEFYNPSAAGVMFTVNKTAPNTSGGAIRNIRFSAYGNVNCTGGVLINGVGFMHIENVAVIGSKNYGFRVQGGDVSGDVMFTSLRHCTVDSLPNATDICYSIFSNSATSRPDHIKLFDCHTNSNSIWVGIDGNGFIGPDSTEIASCGFIGTGPLTALVSNGVNGKLHDNRFEIFSGAMTFTLTPPAGSQPCLTSHGNTFAAPSSVTWTDSGTGSKVSPRYDDWPTIGGRTGRSHRWSTIRFSLLNGGGANVTPDCSNGGYQTIRVTNNTAFNVNAPLNPEDGQELELDFENASGGALGAITFTAGAGGFRTAGAFVAPANGQHRVYRWRYDGAGNAWREVFRNAADQAN